MTNYRETGTASVCAIAAYCSTNALTANVNTVAKQAVSGGTAGGTFTAGLAGGEARKINTMFEITPAAGSTWAAGNYIVRCNVTTANTNITWADTFVCRISSACANQATIGSLTAQTTSMGTTGVKSHTVVGAAQTPAAGDRAVSVLDMTNGAAMTAQTIVLTLDQLIDTPISEPVPAIPTGGLAMMGCGL